MNITGTSWFPASCQMSEKQSRRKSRLLSRDGSGLRDTNSMIWQKIPMNGLIWRAIRSMPRPKRDW